jgi:hypothetical protein
MQIHIAPEKKRARVRTRDEGERGAGLYARVARRWEAAGAFCGSREPKGCPTKVPITYRIDGKKRSAEIPGTLHMSVDPLPTAHPSGEMWANAGHPVSPDKLAFEWEQRETPLTRDALG